MGMKKKKLLKEFAKFHNITVNDFVHELKNKKYIEYFEINKGDIKCFLEDRKEKK